MPRYVQHDKTILVQHEAFGTASFYFDFEWRCVNRLFVKIKVQIRCSLQAFVFQHFDTW
jgi:hypothetical protein